MSREPYDVNEAIKDGVWEMAAAVRDLTSRLSDGCVVIPQAQAARLHRIEAAAGAFVVLADIDARDQPQDWEYEATEALRQALKGAF